MLRVVKEVAPTWVVGENVVGLVSMDGGRVFASIVADLESIGYSVEVFVIPACAVGAPHRRDRVWIVAYRDAEREPQSERMFKNQRRRFGNGNEKHATSDPDNNSSTRQRRNGGEILPIKKAKRHSAGIASTPDTNGNERQFLCRSFAEKEKSGNSNGTVQPDTNAAKPGLQRPAKCEEQREGIRKQPAGCDRGDWQESWIHAATRLCRILNGLSRGLDAIGRISADAAPKKKSAAGRSHRLKSLGNAIVPQVAYEIFKAIKQEDATQNPA